MSTPLADVTFSVYYDPYQPTAGLLASVANAEGFRRVVEVAGLRLEDDSDRDISYRVEIADEAAALALLEALLTADVDVQLDAHSGDAKATARVNTIYVAHGRPADFLINQGPSVAEQKAFAADQANDKLLRKALKRLEQTGLVRAWTAKSLGWADVNAVHPQYGHNPLITLDKDGAKVWGANTSWCPMLRVKTPTGEQGWLCLGSMSRGPLILDSGAVTERIGGVDPALMLTPIDYPRPAGPGLPTRRTLTLPITIEMDASASQSDAEVEKALRNVLKDVLGSGLNLGSAQAATISLDGQKLNRRG